MQNRNNKNAGATWNNRGNPPASRFAWKLTVTGLFALLPISAEAYVGPGAGLTAIGTMIALIAAVCLAIVGFVWYPIKRLLRGRPAAEPGREDTDTVQRTGGADETR